jgi:hypothetical protein
MFITIIYLNVSIIEITVVKHDGLCVLIPKGPTKILKLANPTLPLPRLPKVVIHLGRGHFLTSILPKSTWLTSLCLNPLFALAPLSMS